MCDTHKTITSVLGAWAGKLVSHIKERIWTTRVEEQDTENISIPEEGRRKGMEKTA
jgi:hypothetical protein